MTGGGVLMPEVVNTGNVKATPAGPGLVELTLDEDAVIVEVGNNEHGRWIRFSDGTQVCFGPPGTVGSLAPNGSTVQGLTVYATTLVWTFPREFDATPNVGPANPRLLNSGNPLANHLNSGYASGASAVSVNLRLMALATFTQVENPYPIAIGRWK